MRYLSKRLLLGVVYVAILTFPAAKPVFAAEADSDATCAISVTVDPVMEWAGNFAAIALTSINAYADAPEDNKVQTIYTNCNLTIAADQTATAQLSSGTDTLVTKYKLAEDGDGVATTGATAAEESSSSIATWTVHGSFLGTVLPITHVNTDGAVDVTLYVQATNPASEMADQGSYSATQTLTAAWTSD